jgi:hypothetical protein
MGHIGFGITVGCICAAWVAMAHDMVSRNDRHMERMQRCMVAKRNALDIAPQEAYLLCEKEDR